MEPLLIPAQTFANPMYGPDGTVDPRLVYQEPLRADEPGQWGAPLQFHGDLFAGHAALRSRCHAGYRSVCMTPPDQDGNLDRWLIGVDPASGTRVGPILALGPHQIDSKGNIRDDNAYADGRLVVADAAAGWDEHGLWVSGRIRPEATDHQRAALYGSALSGEWLPSHTGGLELVAMLAVNAPGYVVRRMAAAVGRTVGPICCLDEPDVTAAASPSGLAAALLYGLEADAKPDDGVGAARRFLLVRQKDESGVSGTGVVAEGIQFSDGQCVMRWVGEFQTTTVFASIEDLESIHGHEGSSVISWVDPGSE